LRRQQRVVGEVFVYCLQQPSLAHLSRSLLTWESGALKRWWAPPYRSFWSMGELWLWFILWLHVSSASIQLWSLVTCFVIPDSYEQHIFACLSVFNVQYDETFSVRNPCIKPLSIEEQCGINLTYPGTTEYTDRYVAPPRDKPTSDYIINPVADYRIDGRPMARQRFMCTETEYEVRYEWPDGERLMKFPWLRK